MARTAELLGCCEQTVLNWRKRFLERRSEGPVAALMDLPRSGRPVTYGASEHVQVIAIVCETLHKHELPLSRFSTADLHRIVIQEQGLADLSHASLARMLDQNALKPWRYRYWLFPRDPDFIRKACVILDLYAGFWEGQRLGADEYLLSADEKSIQILSRCHPSLPAILGYEQRVEFEYKRLGTIAYHANIPGHTIGAIKIRSEHTLVDVPEQFVGQVLAKNGDYRVRKQQITIERAN